MRMSNKILYLIFILIVSFLSTSVYAQKPLKKPILHNQTQTKKLPSRHKTKSSNPSYTVSSSVSGSHRGYDYVDLGLPSGLKWATCNVGASQPEEYGNYYAWGETSEKIEYTKLNSKTSGKKIGDISGQYQYDAARFNCGGSWRIPTEKEIEELRDYCNYKWTSYKGVKGALFISRKNGRVLFFPAAGSHDETSHTNAGEIGRFWGSTPGTDWYACFLGFNDESCHDGLDSFYHNFRYYGHTIRPVLEN